MRLLPEPAQSPTQSEAIYRTRLLYAIPWLVLLVTVVLSGCVTPAMMDASRLSNKGNRLLKQGKVDQAIGFYQQALELHPADANTHNGLGIALARKGDLDGSIAAHQEAVRLEPNFAPYRTNLANALGRKGDKLRKQGIFTEAAEAYREATILVPDSPLGYYGLALTLQRRGKVDRAVATYRQALQYGPGNAGIHRDFGLALVRQGEIDEAIKEYRQAIRLNPNDAVAYFRLGEALDQQGDEQGALQAYQRAYRLVPDSLAMRQKLDARLRAYGASAEPPNTEGVEAEGRMIFNGKGRCYRCHGVDGDPQQIPADFRKVVRSLNPAPPDLRNRETLRMHTDEGRFRAIKHGIPGTSMVGFGNRLSEQEIRQVIAYLNALQGR